MQLTCLDSAPLIKLATTSLSCSLRVVVSTSAETVWEVDPLPLLHVQNGNVTFANFTLAVSQPYFNSYPFADGTTWTGRSGTLPSPGA